MNVATSDFLHRKTNILLAAAGPTKPRPKCSSWQFQQRNASFVVDSGDLRRRLLWRGVVWGVVCDVWAGNNHSFIASRLHTEPFVFMLLENRPPRCKRCENCCGFSLLRQACGFAVGSCNVFPPPHRNCKHYSTTSFTTSLLMNMHHPRSGNAIGWKFCLANGQGINTLSSSIASQFNERTLNQWKLLLDVQLHFFRTNREKLFSEWRKSIDWWKQIKDVLDEKSFVNFSIAADYCEQNNDGQTSPSYTAPIESQKAAQCQNKGHQRRNFDKVGHDWRTHDQEWIPHRGRRAGKDQTLQEESGRHLRTSSWALLTRRISCQKIPKF